MIACALLVLKKKFQKEDFPQSQHWSETSLNATNEDRQSGGTGKIMTQNTEKLELPFIMPSQAQKHVTHNEALRMLDALIHIELVSRGENTPPPQQEPGERHLVGDNPTADWNGQAGNLAAWIDGSWMFFSPQPGWLARDASENEVLVFDGSTWKGVTTFPQELQNLAAIGINATADTTNRLAVSAPSCLLTHNGAGHQLKINKATDSDTASTLFQTNYSGRAELGLTGDDNWHVKVSEDGTSWHEVMIADRSSGSIMFPNGQRHAESNAILRSQILTPGGNNVSTIWRFDEPRTGFPRSATIDSISGDTITLADTALYGSNAGTTGPVANKTFFRNVMEGLSFLRLWNVSKSPAQACWIRAATSATDLAVTDSSHLIGWNSGETVQLGEPDIAGGAVAAIDISQFLQLHTGAIFQQAGLALNAGVSAQGNGGWYGHIAISPDASVGSFSNLLSASESHDAAFDIGSSSGGGFITGMLQTGTTVQSPISNSNLLFVREQDAGLGTLRIGLLTVTGVWT